MDPPHPQRHQDRSTASHCATDLESVHSEPKQTTRLDFYDRGNLSRRVGLVGVAVAALVGVGCICAGIVMLLSSSLKSFGYGVAIVVFGDNQRKELYSLSLNLLVTACTEATGSAHGTALRSALASEGRLSFNTNLRLLSAASGVSNPNGTLCNVIMAILLIISYTSSLLITVTWVGDFTVATFAIFPVPLLVLGVALLLQAVIAFASVRSANILTWSSSPFDTTAALVHHAQVLPELGRCMHGVGDDKRQGPVKPCAKQSSAWGAHKGVRRIVLTLWLLVVICVVWGVIIFVLPSGLRNEYKHSGTLWSFFPQVESAALEYTMPLAGGRHSYYWIFYYMNMAAIQGPLTLALHCSELAINLVRDEWAWRRATTKQGATISSAPLASVLRNPLNVALLASKPFLHWMLGIALGLLVIGQPDNSTEIAVVMSPFQIFNYSVALSIFSLALTITVLHRPSGPQPAAYGHIQTLANLIDEWSPTMWWGHKYIGHAGGRPLIQLTVRIADGCLGTSNVRLGEVDMNALYGWTV